MENVYKYRELSNRITNGPIIYKWWFRIEVVSDLLKTLNGEINFNKILVRDGYALLYIGSGINGHERLINYHIIDKNNFHLTGVQNNRLSSLRQTLCGLLGQNMSSSKEIINEFMDLNCKIEWEIYNNVINKKELEKIETAQIRENYLPLNWQNTSDILTRNHRKLLTQLKNKVRL